MDEKNQPVASPSNSASEWHLRRPSARRRTDIKKNENKGPISPFDKDFLAGKQ